LLLALTLAVALTVAGYPSTATAAADRTVISRAGWFHIVYNGAPLFLLVDDSGAGVRLLLDEQILKPFGGPRALDRKRVTVTATAVADALRVLSIRVESQAP
jgi:hypothetical protein